VTAPRGAPGRAATAQRDAWRTIRLAAAFLVTAAVVGVVGGRAETWTALHLLLVGGVLGAVSAATQLFAVTWSASPAPPSRVVALQRWSLAAGALIVVVGRRSDAPAAVVGAGGGAVLLALTLLAWILWWVRARVVTDRFVPAIDTYLIAVALGAIGTSLGVAMVSGGLATASAARDAHIALNLFGLVGLVVLGTLPTFVATQVRAKVSPSATPARVRATAILMAGATATASIGLLLELGPLAAVGFAGVAAVAASTFGVLPRLGSKQREWAGPRLVQLLTALGWWVVAAGWAAIWSLDVVAADRLWLLLGVGAYTQLVVASLAYLAPILRGRDHRAQPLAFRITRSWVSVIAGNVVAGAIVLGTWSVVVAGVTVWALDLVVRAVVLVVRVRPTPLPSGR
jgi:nitrite reductase (NO-forming)